MSPSDRFPRRRQDVLRFRQNGAILVAAMIAFVSAVPLAGAAWALSPILLIPLAVGVWAWRSGTDADASGLTVRALLGSRRIAWPQVVELAADPRGRVMALRNDGHAIRLTAVRATDLPRLVAASGQRADDVADHPSTDAEPTPDIRQP